MIRGWNGCIDDIADTDLAILPIGSIENHGPHLPVVTDWIISDSLGRGIAEKTGGFYIPSLPISTNKEHRGKRGSVGMHSDTFYRMITDICLDLKTQGFKKICIVQGHGGIFVMNPAIRELNADHNPDLMVVNVDIMEVCWQAFKSSGLCETDGIHAEEIETSLMLHLHPELVDMSKAVDFTPKVPRSYLNYGSMLRYCPQGVWGSATKANAEKGRKMMEIAVDVSIEHMNRIFEMMSAKQVLN
ncbi:MAG: creatininase family protein, partial [Spirochaetaceae bacterium]|nr:creatininase family protein [Spirochaetaceae bacterium]